MPRHVPRGLSSIQGCNFTLVSYLKAAPARPRWSSPAPSALPGSAGLCGTTPVLPPQKCLPRRWPRKRGCASHPLTLLLQLSRGPARGWPAPWTTRLPPREPRRPGQPPSRASSLKARAAAYLGHFGDPLLPGRGGGRHGCSVRPRASPGPHKPTGNARLHFRDFRKQSGSRNRKRKWLGDV